MRITRVRRSPGREGARLVIGQLTQLVPDGVLDGGSVFCPEYVVGRGWGQLLHNQSALRLKGRLLFQQGVMVTSVPWQLDSAGSVTPGVPKDDQTPVAGG